MLGKDFVPLEIDIERMAGGVDLEQRFTGMDTRSVGLPWLVFLDGEGVKLASAPFGIDLFKSMLHKDGSHLSDQDVAKLIASLEKATKVRAKDPSRSQAEGAGGAV
jgi:hypothetical protein